MEIVNSISSLETDLYQGLLTENIWKYFQLTVGAAIGAASVIVFLVPANVVPQGISGIAALLNALFGLPIGIVVLLINIPILYMGHRMLPGGWWMTVQSVFVVVLFSVFIDAFTLLLPEVGYSDDRLLNTLFGGILGGISGGIVYRTGTNYGGTSVLALILQRKFGLPLSTTFMYTDTVIILVSGFIFGIEGALYAIVALFLSGLASDYVMEGPSVIRTVFVVTEQPYEVSEAVMARLQRGVTAINARGMYTGKERSFLYITISRAQVNELRSVISDVDERAFIVVGQGHTAYGGGFKPVKKNGKNGDTIQKVMSS